MNRPVFLGMHRVEDGERLSAIAQRYGIGVDDMVRANPAKPRLQTIGGAVFETLSVGELLAVPAPLGAAEVPNPPRVFLEDALQEVTESNQGNVTFATKRTKLDNARRKVASARLYVESRKLGAEHLARIDEILADVEWLQDLAIAQTNGPNPENPASIDNWYPRIDRLKKRLSTEIGKFFQFATTTQLPGGGSSGSSGGATGGNYSPGKAGLPGQGSFPGSATTEPIKAKIQQAQAGDVVTRIDKSGGGGENKEFTTAKTSDEVAREQFCDSLPPELQAFYAIQNFDCPHARPNIIAGVERCASMGMAYSASQAERDPSGVTKGCVDIAPPKEKEKKETKIVEKDVVVGPVVEPVKVEEKSKLPWIIGGVVAVAAIATAAVVLTRKKGQAK